MSNGVRCNAATIRYPEYFSNGKISFTHCGNAENFGFAPAPGLQRIAGEVHADAVAAARRRQQKPPERVATAGRRKADMSGKPEKRPK